MKKIIVINGEAGSGKDTFVKLLQENISDKKVWNYSSVDKVKEIAKACGWNGIKDSRSRKFLSDLKDLTEAYNQLPYNSMVEKITSFKENTEAEILFLHVREPEQIKQLQDEFGCKSMIIKRNNYSTIKQSSNHADAFVYNYTYDYEIPNPGTTLADYNEIVNKWLFLIGYEKEKVRAV